MIILLVTWVINNLFLGIINDLFSNLKLIIFIITGFICSNKDVKQVDLINHSWFSPISQRRWELEPYLFSKKMWGFLRKKGEVDKLVEGDCQERVTYDCCLS